MKIEVYPAGNRLLALASAAYYGALTYVVSRLGTNLDDVVAFVGHMNRALAIVAGILFLVIVTWILIRRRRPPPPPPVP